MTSASQVFGAPLFGSQMEILDLRHFSAAQLRPLLQDEAVRWQRRLHWDYTASADLLLEYLEGRVLPGYAAMLGGRVIGYAFAVYEGAKAVIGDAYAFGETESLRNPVCDTLLHHLIEMLQATPGVDRIESQLLMFPAGALAAPFLARGFRAWPRLFMSWEFPSAIPAPAPSLPTGFHLESWRPEFYDPGAQLVHRCYLGHMDSGINDQYRSIAGSARFLHNIIRFPGCGVFDPANSWVLRNLRDNRLEGMILSSRVRDNVAHVTQLCVSSSLRGKGFGKLLLQQCASRLAIAQPASISLTVTEANTEALRLYNRLGFKTLHRFEAMVWQKETD
jgi:ribosomal protein S18 acetylase RimI-like enzyme